jgi:hypothetical protein
MEFVCMIIAVITVIVSVMQRKNVSVQGSRRMNAFMTCVFLMIRVYVLITKSVYGTARKDAIEKYVQVLVLMTVD